MNSFFFFLKKQPVDGTLERNCEQLRQCDGTEILNKIQANKFPQALKYELSGLTKNRSHFPAKKPGPK